ncbi:hypothetical protein N7931_11545 [Catenovulum sp. 2E275]|uniref:hypothetical protein n=1 Tax=Catenovulum sp. 2E275 TaxID=2980497 RepID=UPI0021D325DB|nr:hypothetical protein [Catenovulum sp. 2E275]MCU4676263.1 hypothetical protein [Catenovulum sp. 2E275]
MNYIALNWDILIRAVFPFTAANVYSIVLIYFTLVRYRIGSAYPWYGIFIVSFTLFLCGPLINLMPVEEARRWFDLMRNVVLYTFGMPALIYGLCIQANITNARKAIYCLALLGFCWSLFFAFAPPFYMDHLHKTKWLHLLSGVSKQQVYYSQIALISVQLLLPCLFLLQQSLKQAVKLLILGVLLLFTAMTIGLSTEQWAIYYGGSAFTAIVWIVAVYKDIQITNHKIKQHHLHQNSMALAQYTAPTPTNFVDYYPNKINEDYPFKEREALLEAVNHGHIGVVAEKVEKLTSALSVLHKIV